MIELAITAAFIMLAGGDYRHGAYIPTDRDTDDLGSTGCL